MIVMKPQGDPCDKCKNNGSDDCRLCTSNPMYDDDGGLSNFFEQENSNDTH